MPSPNGEESKTRADKLGVHVGIYVVVSSLLLTAGAVVSFMWFFAATMASDGCHGNDADYICTVEGQHWALVLPVVAFVAAAVVAFVSPICVAAFKWYPALIWIGVPLTIGAYVVAPKVANWGRLQEIW